MPEVLGVGLAIALVLAVVVSFDQLRRQRASGMPTGQVLQQDTLGEDEGTRGEVLYSALYGLRGRPDYLVQEGQYVIPVEVKTTRNVRSPRDGHQLQLFAYCLLVEEKYGVSPPYGILRYPNQHFRIPYGEAERAWVLDVLAAMREDEQSDDVLPNHDQPARCRRCQFYGTCGREVVDDNEE